MRSDILARIAQLADRWHELYAELDRLAREGGYDDWDEVALPIIEEARRIEGELWRLQRLQNEQGASPSIPGYRQPRSSGAGWKS